MDIKLKYANIQGWMYEIGCDNLREVVAYAIIYGFSQDEESTFKCSLPYVMKLLMCSKHTAIDTLRSLEEKGLIIKTQKVMNKITFNEYSAIAPVVQKFHYPSEEIAPNNNIDNNIPPNDSTLFDISHKDSIIIPQGSVEKSVKRFVKPTIEQIKAYCEERNNGIDAEDFYYFYESKGWKIGSSPMKDWKAAIRTWESKNKKPRIIIDTHGKSFDERRDEFYNSLTPYIQKYGRDLVRKFYVYWSQKTTDGNYMLWELKPAFELSKRLEEEYLKTKR